jgi:adenylate kinase family enzyme
MKVLIIILGSGASGKSTLTRQLCGVGGVEYIKTFQCLDQHLGEQRIEKAKYTLFPNGSAIAGNIKNSSDAIQNMEARAKIINWLLDQKEVQFVITDPVRSSKKWDVDWIQSNPREIAAVYVYLDLSLEENLRRLVQRREANGKTTLGEKTYQNMLAFRERAANVWAAAKQNYKRKPVRFVCLYEHLTPIECSKQVKAEIALMMEEIERTERLAKS